MINTDKVLIGLGQHISGRTSERCMACPYFNGDSGYGVSCRDELLDDLYEMLEAQEPWVMTLEEAQAITKPGTLAWLEASGGYEGTRYRAIPVIISDNTHGLLPEDAMHFYNTADRAWSHYNQEVCGWRLWTAEPTDKQREAEPWKS